MKSVFNKKRVIYAVLFFAIAAAAIFFNPFVHEYFTETKIAKLRFQTGIDYSMAVYGREVLLINNEGMIALDRNGREMWNVVCAATSPVVEAKNKYIMLADISGRTVNVYQKDKLVTQIKTEREILSAKLNKNGYVAIVTEEPGYKGQLTVYDRRGKEIFRWHSGSGYIGDADISANNSIAVSQIMTDRESVYSKVLFLNINGDEEAKCAAELDGIVMKVRYGSGGGVTAISGSGFYGFKKNGDLLFEVGFQGRELCGYNINNENNMVLAFEDGLNNTVLESYSAKGVLRGSYESGSKINVFDVSGECILAAKQRDIVRLTPEGKVKSEVTISHDVKEMKIFPGRKNFITVGGSSAELLKIR